VQHWLLVRGRGGAPLDPRVDAAAIVVHSSSRRPSVAPGDAAILYAAEWQAIFGVVEIVGDAEHDDSRERWAWRFPIRARAVVPDLHGAPAVEEAGIFPQSIWRHSHIRLTPEQFERAEALIRAVERSAPNRHERSTHR
jgi:hypothetical protein